MSKAKKDKAEEESKEPALDAPTAESGEASAEGAAVAEGEAAGGGKKKIILIVGGGFCSTVRYRRGALFYRHAGWYSGQNRCC